jgi:NADH:ubiquinone oxidoreductase subunit 4 (subunit M)
MIVPLVIVMVELPLLWGIIGAVVGGIVTSFVRGRISSQPNLATIIGELVTIVLLVWAILTFSPDTGTGEFNFNAEIIGMIFIAVTIGTEDLFRKRDQPPDAPE